jgi:hypothetical protein
MALPIWFSQYGELAKFFAVHIDHHNPCELEKRKLAGSFYLLGRIKSSKEFIAKLHLQSVFAS